MAEVRPLRGVRFDTSHSGPLGPLIAPPYDVVSEQTSGAEFSILKIESVDLGSGNDHASAAARYRDWLREGVLRPDPTPMIYVHRHQFNQNSVSHVRTGLMARVRLADWSERIVLPHESTTPGPRAERLDRLRSVQANLSPLYFLYRDPNGDIRNLIASHAPDNLTLTDRDQMGGAHGLTAVADAEFHERLRRAFAGRSLFVADGHHRYEAALTYRDERRALQVGDPDAPSKFVLTMLVAVEDPGVVVRPTHRLIVGSPKFEPKRVLDVVRQLFDVRNANAETPLPKQEFICRVALPNDVGIWDLFAKSDKRHQILLPSDRGTAWRSLGVAAVESVVQRVLERTSQTADTRVLPVVDGADAVAQVRDGRAQAAFLLPAPDLDRLLAVAEEGDLLPAKSTWFEPKAPAGFVISDFRL